MADLVSGARVSGVSLSNDLHNEIGIDSPTVVPRAIPPCSRFSAIHYTDVHGTK